MMLRWLDGRTLNVRVGLRLRLSYGASGTQMGEVEFFQRGKIMGRVRNSRGKWSKVRELPLRRIMGPYEEAAPP